VDDDHLLGPTVDRAGAPEVRGDRSAQLGQAGGLTVVEVADRRGARRRASGRPAGGKSGGRPAVAESYGRQALAAQDGGSTEPRRAESRGGTRRGWRRGRAGCCGSASRPAATR
jgi:hypothetical protein